MKPELLNLKGHRQRVGEHNPNHRTRAPLWTNCSKDSSTTAFWLLLIVAAGGIATVGGTRIYTANPENSITEDSIVPNSNAPRPPASNPIRDIIPPTTIFKPTTKTTQSSAATSTRTLNVASTSSTAQKNSPTFFRPQASQCEMNKLQANLALSMLKRLNIQKLTMKDLSFVSGAEYEYGDLKQRLAISHTSEMLKPHFNTISAEDLGLNPNEAVIPQLEALYKKLLHQPSIIKKLKPETAAALYIYWQIEIASQIKCAKEIGYGSNSQIMAYIYNQLLKQRDVKENAIRIESVIVVDESNADKHYERSFIIIGRDQNSKLNEPDSWGPDAVVIDAFAKDASQIIAVAEPLNPGIINLYSIPAAATWSLVTPFASNYEPSLKNVSPAFQEWYARTQEAINAGQCFTYNIETSMKLKS